MNVLIINASPNKEEGYTHKTTEIIRDAFLKRGDHQAEQLFLMDLQQPYCDGCMRCIKEGDQACPALDKVAPVEQAIRRADAIVVASPVHSFNVGAMLKTMIDLFVKEIHRPSFFGKKVAVVATSTGGGQQTVLKYMRNALSLWGMDVVGRLGTAGSQFKRPDYVAMVEASADQLVDKLIAAVDRAEDPSPALIDLISFRVMRTVMEINRQDVLPDIHYWEERGWMTADYFTDAPRSWWKNLIARFIGSVVRNQVIGGKLKPVT
ncbi:MAG: NAD(P)H-dependent oxidoreductase [Proteobacteria bacterium]|nr:NAD(P)H-dependent oxidoreductase [Pseudomonadota bacterium]